jgi:hypothetical protein
LTGTVVTGNVAVVAPAAIVTVAGTLTLPLTDRRSITMPPAGAGFVTVSVATELFPPTTLDGANVMLFGATRLTSNVDEIPAPSASAEMATAMSLPTIRVCIGNVADVAPAGTVTVAGTTTLELEEERLTTCPPTPALLARATVPTPASPPMMVDGETVSVFGKGTRM